MQITNKYGPNTTVLLPGSCNANCHFCFWNRDESKIKPDNYLNSVFGIMKNLPDVFSCLSISGGEPTISPYFTKFLARLGAYRRTNNLTKVVLTSNGCNVDPHIDLIGCVVDHINISRHGIGDAQNYGIFQTVSVPSDAQLKQLIMNIHSKTIINVTLNCVVRENVSIKFCYDFIEYAKDLGADAVSFRKVASNVEPTRTELYFVEKYEHVAKTNCPVCRVLSQNVDGFSVGWKGTVNEPSLETNGIYEAVIHPDGKLYRDWGMSHQISISEIETKTQFMDLETKKLILGQIQMSEQSQNAYRNVSCGAVSCGVRMNSFQGTSCGSSGC